MNIETDLDVMNGARGKIVDILHPDEPPLSNELIVTLNHFPSYILVKMQRTCASQTDLVRASFLLRWQPATSRSKFAAMEANMLHGVFAATSFQ